MKVFGNSYSQGCWHTYNALVPRIPHALMILLFGLFFQFNVYGQVVINEIYPDGTVELKNTGDSEVNVSSYWLCNFPDYDQLSSANIVCGELLIQPGATLAVDNLPSVPVDGAEGEMGLYSNNSFGSPVGLIDYVEWGFTGHVRSSVAVTAGQWTTGDFVPAIPAGSSISFDGEGNMASDWAAGTPTICEDEDPMEGDCTVDGGTISTNDPTVICVDGNPDPIDVAVAGSSGPNGGWIITDDANNILALPAAPPFDLDGAGEGVCLIWYIRYEDGLTGKEGGNNISDLDGCFDLSNSITVYREAPDGGTVSLLDGSTEYTGCAGSIVFDVMHTTTAPNLSYWYIITDDNDNILAFANSANTNTLDLSGAPAGVCRIWGWSYRGLPNPVVGEPISSLTDDDCEAISDNFITVNREEGEGVDGGMISTNDPTVICVDGNPDPIDVTVSGSSGANGGWIITDDANNILALPAAPPFDLDGAGEGVCLIWYIRYEDGLMGKAAGNNLSDLDGCYDLSNSITVYREAPDGGTVSLLDGTTDYIGCAGDIVFDVMHTTTAPNLSYWYIITDDNDNILAFANSADTNTLDLSGAPAGTCRIWGWSYRGLPNPVVGEPISSLADDDCEAISDNFITVYREEPDGGMVSLVDGSTEYTGCAGNIVVDVTHTTSAEFLSYWYIITDDNDNILAYANSANTNTLDLSGAPAGVCRIWGWSYRGLPNPVAGEPISTLADDFCEAISDNFITVIREESTVDGGTISTNDPTVICVDGNPDPIDVAVDGSVGPNGGWIITDDANNILALPAAPPFDFDGAGEGVCLIWYIRYEDGLMGKEAGNNLSDLDGCYDLSNSITVYREAPDGGTVSLLDGSTDYIGCAGDIVFDVMHTTTAPNLSYWYIITDDNDNILAFANSANTNTLDLSGAPAGTCRIWGWSYRGLPNPVVGEPISSLADDDCEAISDNFITVYREDPDGGTVSLLDGSTEYTGCAGDIVVDVMHTTTAEFLSYWYIITDDNDNILAYANSANTNTLDLSGAPAGVCRIWGWSYRGLPNPVAGESITTLMDDFCEAISDNFITVNRVEGEGIDGGDIYAEGDLMEVDVCVGDGNDDVITFRNSAVNGAGVNYQLVITDDTGVILGLPPANSANFEGAGPGVCLAWNLYYTGELTAAAGDNALEGGLASGCYALSEDYVRINRTEDCFGAYVESFTLINADTDEELLELYDGAVIDLAKYNVQPDRLNIRANLSGLTPGSVVFDFDETNAFRIEQVAPYALSGDTDGGGDYNPVGNAMSLGTHSLAATPYSSYQGKGLPGQGLGIEFTLVYGSARTSNVASSFGRLTAFPNPSNGKFSLSAKNGVAGAVSVQIMNMAGVVIRQNTFESQTGNLDFDVDISGESSGIYLIRIQNGNQVFSAKVQKR